MFRAMWLASLVSNLGTQAQAMAAGWLMTELTDSAMMVSLVQGVATLPIMLFAMLAGTLGDIYNKRRVMIFALSGAFVVSCALALVAWMDWINPISLLVFTCLIAFGYAFFAPNWHSSIRLLVGRDLLPAAIGLNSSGFHLARGVAPLLGGVMLAFSGATLVFGFNALSFIGIICALYLWQGGKQQPQHPSADPSGTLRQELVRGIRYAFGEPQVRIILLHVGTMAFAGSIFWVLMPLIARDLMGGDADTFARALTVFALGSVFGGLFAPILAARIGINRMLMFAQILIILATLGVAMKLGQVVSLLLTGLVGMGWLMCFPTLNSLIQMVSPVWLSSRVLSVFQTIMFMGLTLGSLVWGLVAESFSLQTAMFLSVLAVTGTTLLTRMYPVVDIRSEDADISAEAP